MSRIKPVTSEPPRRAKMDAGANACACAWAGCTAAGEYRAPQDRTLSSYVMFCLEHVRAYNAKWDFHVHMSPNDIEAEIRRMQTWDRPTWPLGTNGGSAKKARPWGRADIKDPLDLGAGTAFDPTQGKKTRQKSWADEYALKPDERKALRVFEIDGPITLTELKVRYKKLVKQHHPDKNGGSAEAETRMKIINGAYQLLSVALQRKAKT